MTALFTRMSVSGIALSAAVVAGVLTLGTAPTEAATLGFSCATNNAASSCAIGQSQLSAELTDLGNGSVQFLFRNTGAEGATVTQLYFDQSGPAQMSLGGVAGSSGVAFDLAAARNVAGGSGIQVRASQGGINSGQWLQLIFTLNQGSTFASLLTSLSTGDLRIGTHVQAIGALGNSESFVNQQPTVVPEPASMILLGTGLAGAAAARRRRRRVEAQTPK